MIVKILQEDIDKAREVQKKLGSVGVSILAHRHEGPLVQALRRMGFDKINAGLLQVFIGKGWFALGDDYLEFLFGKNGQLRQRGIKPATINIEGLTKP